MIDINSDSERDSIIVDLLPDLTPLLDVMFMLLVFLILTTNALTRSFDINLPEDKENVSKASSDDVISVTIFSDQEIWALNDKKFQSFENLKSALLANYNSSKSKNVVIYGDKKATIDRFMQLLTFMRAHGIEAADIVTQ